MGFLNVALDFPIFHNSWPIRKKEIFKFWPIGWDFLILVYTLLSNFPQLKHYFCLSKLFRDIYFGTLNPSLLWNSICICPCTLSSQRDIFVYLRRVNSKSFPSHGGSFQVDFGHFPTANLNISFKCWVNVYRVNLRGLNYDGPKMY